MGLNIPETMLDFIDDEAKFWLTNHPALKEPSATEQALNDRYGEIEPDEEAFFQQAKKAIELAKSDPELAMPVISGLMNRPSEMAKLLTEQDKKLSKKISGDTGSVLILSVLIKRYVAENKWNRIKTKNSALSALLRFKSCVGDIDVHEITQKDAYKFSKYLEDEFELANKSIKAHVSYVKGLFTWCITEPSLTNFVSNPFTNLRLKRFGTASEPYIPYRNKQLLDLFALANFNSLSRMSRREHLCLSILIATGCRLDEAALLCWENIIEHKEGWHYIDLTKAIVKNSGSRRLLPIPDQLQSLMPPRGHQVTVDGLGNSPDDRLFNYSLDKDGKASRAASQACGRQIAKINPDNKQVTHSFRGNLKDLNHYITGHSQGDVGSNYGQGHSIEKRYEALNLPVHPYLRPYDTL